MAAAAAFSCCHGIGGMVVVVVVVMAMLLGGVAAGEPPFSCGGAAGEQGYAFCDATLAAAERAADLVARLTAAEKVAQLGDQAAGAIGTEARALYNIGQAEGLTMWSPNVNIFRDPRWGRGQETPGEDPTIASKYAVAFVKGMQGNSSAILQTSACCKHVTAYDLEDWNGVQRYNFNAKVTMQDLEDTYNPPFRSCVVDAKATCIMCAYTGINGVPACANADLLTKTVRGDWGLDGYIASDCDAVAILRDAQRYTQTPEDAVAVALKAGLDMNCGTYVQQHATAAIQQGKLTEEDIDKALKNLFTIRMRLGHFNGDPRSNSVYGGLGAADICTPEHRSLALEAAMDGIVLLKNDAGILPLDRTAVASAAVIGPNANDGMALIGNYFGPPCESTTPLNGILGYLKNVRFLTGCNSAACDVAATDQAAAVASSSDYVFLFMGLSQKQESEGRDRTSLLLPGEQQSLIAAVADAAKRPVILVLLTGGPVDITFAQANPKIGAILWAGYPGQAGGLAIARVLFGDHNPGGRLPVTWYPEEFTKVPMTDMRMRADPATGYPGRSYRFYQGKTVYKFGYGLSYSSYSRQLVSGGKPAESYTNLLASLRTTTSEGDESYHIEEIGTDGCEQLKFPAVVEVQNHGPMDGKHSVLMYLRWPNAKGGRPTTQLIGFRSQHLKVGEKANIRFDISPCEHFSRVRQDGKKVIDRGSHYLMVDKDELEIRFEA
uniref:Fibronectin type III-like domain-containing protein n=1 Tax=Oryza punctata TaxID=4537 RepID=A0A0E0MET5_ORYPU